MTEEIKQEALEQLVYDIKFGFENEEALFDGIRDMFYDEEDFDEDWLRQTIAEKYSAHQRESASWKHPTDFERLANAFDELIKEGIICLHKAGYTRSDGEEDCMEVIEKLKQSGIQVRGFCYYHTQDLMRAVDPESCNLWLGFGSSTHNDGEAIVVAKDIIQKLNEHGFETSWAGTVDQRIKIRHIDWKKIPDDQNWRGERVMQILSASETLKKPYIG